MALSKSMFAALLLAAHVALVGAADVVTPVAASAQEEHACAGVANESTKRRELVREMGAYLGETVPDDLQNRVRRHFELIAKLKAECEKLRAQSVTAR